MLLCFSNGCLKQPQQNQDQDQDQDQEHPGSACKAGVGIIFSWPFTWQSFVSMFCSDFTARIHNFDGLVHYPSYSVPLVP